MNGLFNEKYTDGGMRSKGSFAVNKISPREVEFARGLPPS